MHRVLFWSVFGKEPDEFIIKTEKLLEMYGSPYIRCGNVFGKINKKNRGLVEKAEIIVIVLGKDPRERDNFMLWWRERTDNVIFVCPGSSIDPFVHRFITGFHLNRDTVFTTLFLPYDSRGFLARYHTKKHILPFESRTREEDMKKLCGLILGKLARRAIRP